jgi:hypothetical protein
VRLTDRSNWTAWPRERTHRAGPASRTWRLNGGREIEGHTPGRVQESEEGSEARADVGDHDESVAPSSLHAEGVDVIDPDGCETTVSAAKKGQEGRRVVALPRNRPRADTAMATLMIGELSDNWG